MLTLNHPKDVAAADFWLGPVVCLFFLVIPSIVPAACLGAEALPKYVIALIDGRKEPDPESGRIANNLTATLAKHGLLPVYVDVSRQLPDVLPLVDVAGLISWFDGAVPNPSDLGDWLDIQSEKCGRPLPEVTIGDPGGAALWTRLVTKESGVLILHDGTTAGLETAPNWFLAEAALSVPPGRLMAPPVPPNAKALATFLGPDGARRAIGFQIDNRTWLSDHAVMAQDARGSTLWFANPDRIVEAFTGNGPRPVPDLALFQGRRIALSILLADGWSKRAPASAMSSLGTAAFEFANEVYGSDGAVVTFGWPDPTITPSSEDRSAFAAGLAFADKPHVSPVPVDIETDGVSFQTSFSLRLSSLRAGVLSATPRLDPPTLPAIEGKPGFGDHAGLHARTATVADSDDPWPSGPDTLVIHAEDLLDFSAREAAMQARGVHSSPERAAMDIPRYAAWLSGAASTRLFAKGPHTWYIHDRGDLNTVRLDRTETWALDAARSEGVLGARRLGSSLFVALDPAINAPLVTLTRRKETDMELAGQMIGIVEAGPTLSNMRADGCMTKITATGHGRITFRATHRPDVTADAAPLDVTSIGDGKWRVYLPKVKVSSTVSFAVGCD